MRSDCIVRIPVLTIDDTSKKAMLVTDMECQKECKKVTKQDQKIDRLFFRLREQ